MSRRRNVSNQRIKTLAKAIPWDYRIQRLEDRLLFTTFSAPAGVQDTFEYEAEGGGVMRIAYSDITFEALGVSVNPTTNATTVGDLIRAGVTAPAAPVLPFNLFTIYVTQSAPDSYITIAPVPRESATPTPGVIRADQPFGVGQPLLVNPANNIGGQYSVTPGAGIGAGVLGAFTFAVTGGEAADIPITEVPDPGSHGVYPGNILGDGLLHAGLYVPKNGTTGLPQSMEAFKFAGEIFGNVEISGNIQLFYAGAILTGDATGVEAPGDFGVATSASTVGNFTIGGDIRDLITSGDIGGDVGNATSTQLPNYDTGFTAIIGGKVGEVYELNGGFFGTMDVQHSSSVVGLTDSTPEQELEYQNTGIFIVGDTGGIGQIFQGDTGYLSTLQPDQLPAPFTNDTAATAQYLGTAQTVNASDNVVLNTAGNPVYDTEVTGTLQDGLYNKKTGDPADWYAVSMLAGVTMTISVSSINQTYILAELEDPDGRLVASDVQATSSGTFEYTTDRPGIYRIGLLQDGLTGEDLSYTLTITGTGNEGVGALAASGEVSDMGLDGFLEVDNGDLGGVVAGGNILSGTLGPTESTELNAPLYSQSSIIVARGDLRTVTATSIGIGTDVSNDSTGVTYSFPLTLSVPNGNVGLVDATGTLATDVLALETQYDPNQLLADVYKTDDLYAHAIGGNIEVINAGSTFYGLIATNAGIGTIRAANMATSSPSHIDVNADDTGDDGIIDLIDVPGQFGVIGGGPEFVTNTGGNIRYLNLNSAEPIFLPTAFGGLQDEAVTYPVGATDSFTDDSGATFTVTASGPVVTNTINNSNGTTTQQSEGTQVTVLSYPVLDHAGQVPVSISATTPANVSAGSLTINGTGVNGPNSEVDVANISITGEGRPISTATTNSSAGVVTTTTDAFGNAEISQPYTTNQSAGIVTGPMTDPTDEFLSITGPATFNVLNVNAGVILPIYAGNSPVEVANTTRGEVVNLNAPEGLGTLLVDGNLGFSTPQASPAAVMPAAQITNGDTYPFVQQHTGVVIGTGFLTGGISSGTTGDIVSITVGGAAGNIQAGGTIQSLIVNSAQSTGVKGTSAIVGQFDGIVGPVIATRLLYVDVGQGLAPTGSGTVGLSGLYATGKIGEVTNAGNPNGDIRGNIVSAEDYVDGEALTADDGIDEINIGNASIINSTIATVADTTAHAPQFQETSELIGTAILITTNGQNFAPGQTTTPTYDIGPIIISGDGGIIGSQIRTGSVESIIVNAGGFGILTTHVIGLDTGKIGNISASGYGIRDSNFQGFGYIGQVTATGNGKLIPSTAYPIDVRPSDEDTTYDEHFGIYPTDLNDINAVLGTSRATPNIADSTDTGVIQDDIFNGQNTFSGLTAQKARTELPLVTAGTAPIPEQLNIPAIGTVFDNSITFGGAVGVIRINQEVDGLQITAGSLAGLAFSTSVNRLGISVAGAIQTLTIRGNLGEYVTDPTTGNLVPDSYINAAGPNGVIGTVRVLGNMNANIYATAEIGSILITGDLLGGVIAYGKSNTYALGTLRVYGGIRDGSLILDGNVGSIIANRTLGTSAGKLTIDGNVNLISVGANHALHGSQLALALDVTGTLKSLVVYGSITGSVTTRLDLTHLTVTNDGTTPNAITGAITVDGRLGAASIVNGNVASNIIVTGNIGSFTITRGDLNASSSVQSQLGILTNFRVTGGLSYGVYGSILAAESTNGSIDISGNLGDGVNAAVITAYSGTTLRVRGSVASGASVTYGTYLNLLQVLGSVEAGATITAAPIKKQQIIGLDSGTIVSV